MSGIIGCLKLLKLADFKNNEQNKLKFRNHIPHNKLVANY